MSSTAKSRLEHYKQVASFYGYQNDLYGEWLIDGDKGLRPCRPENWCIEDQVSFLGGNYAKNYYSIEEV